MARAHAEPVDATLSRFSPEQFDELLALDRLEGDPLDRLAEILKRGFAAICMSGLTPDDFDPQGEKPQPPLVSPATAADLAKAAYGGR